MHCLAFARNSRCVAAAAAVFAVGGDEPSDTLWTALAECRERKLETLVGIETLQTLSAIHGRSHLGWTSFATRSTLADGTSAAHEHYGKAKPHLSLASAAVQFQRLVFRLVKFHCAPCLVARSLLLAVAFSWTLHLPICRSICAFSPGSIVHAAFRQQNVHWLKETISA